MTRPVALEVSAGDLALAARHRRSTAISLRWKWRPRASAKALSIGRASVHRMLQLIFRKLENDGRWRLRAWRSPELWTDALPVNACAVDKTPSHHRVSPRRVRPRRHRHVLWHQAPALRPAIPVPD